MSALTDCSARQLVEMVAARQVSVQEVVAAFRARAEALNPAINAVTTFNPRCGEEASASDARLARGEPARPLEGVPVVVKDIIPTAGIRTTYGSLVYEHNVPGESAVLVQRLQAAGAIVLGKSNTSEFATDVNTTNKIFGITRNPVDLNVSPGGSSGGTAAAIASDMVPMGIGTDLGGSIRIPSAWCGVSGLRPSPGRVPIHPADYAWDTLVEHVQGPMARTVGDVGLLLSVLAGQDDRDPSSLPNPTQDYAAAAVQPPDMKGRRIAYCETFGGVVPVDPAVAAATRAAAKTFEDMGAIVEEAAFDASDIRDIIAGTRGFGIVARFADLVAQHGERMASQLTGQTADALRQDLRSVARAEKLRSDYWHRVRVFLERYEFILTPAIGAPPFRLDRPLPTEVGGKAVDRYYDVFLPAYAFSLVGLPVACVPCGEAAQGFPVGLQVVGRRLREDRVLAAAAAYAQARPEKFERWEIPLSKAVKLDYEMVTPGMRTGADRK